MTDDGYDATDYKSGDYREPYVCAICTRAYGHFVDCPEQREAHQ